MSEKDKSLGEPVDGPKIVADILNRMNPANKEKIVRAIQASNPEIATKIEEKLFNFDDIAELTPQGVQVLLKEIDQNDLLLSLKTASKKASSALFENMSERRRQIVQSDFENMGQRRLSEVDEAQKRILRKLDELRTAGLIKTQGKQDVWV